MKALRQFFFARTSITLWANLGGVFMVHPREILSTLPAYPRQQLPKLSETSIEHMLTQEAFSRYSKVDILDKYHVRLIAKLMASLKLDPPVFRPQPGA